MYKSIKCFIVLLLFSFCTELVLSLEQQQQNEQQQEQEQQTSIKNTTTNSAEIVPDNVTNITVDTARQARLMQHVQTNDKRQQQRVNVKSRPHKHLLTRSDDNFHYRHASVPLPVHAVHKKRYPILRRVHSPHAAIMSNNFYEPHKNSRFSTIKNNNNNNIKSSSSNNHNVYRGTNYAADNHPNALLTSQNNFKASPLFTGQAVVRPVYELLAEAQKQSSVLQQQQQLQLQKQINQQDTYAQIPVKQYPLPYVIGSSNNNNANNYLNQYEQYTPQQQHHQQQPQQQPTAYYQNTALTSPYNNNNNNNNNEGIIKQYAVYEEPLETINNNNNKNVDSTVATVKFANALDAQEALEFLKFMGSDGYFLPKIEPNYKNIDEQNDNNEYNKQQQQLQQQQQLLQQQYYQEQQQQQLQQQKYLYEQKQHQQQQQQQHEHEQNLLQHEIINNNPSYESNKNLLESPSLSQLFFPDHHNNINKVPRNSNVVQASYQTANNLFVVNSDGNKSVKHIVSSTPHTLSAVTGSRETKSHQHAISNSIRRRTPEPVRFEFTEQDAMVLAPFTSSPITAGAAAKRGSNKLGGSTTQYIKSTTQRPVYFKNNAAIHNNNNNNNNNNDNDDENIDDGVRENHEDMQLAANSDIFGRVPVKKTAPSSSISTAVSTPSEVRDTEEYCERICANVQDDDEEVICGSDGYMYTSEAQLECYASCLHLDVTITGKGSCSAR